MNRAAAANQNPEGREPGSLLTAWTQANPTTQVLRLDASNFQSHLCALDRAYDELFKRHFHGPHDDTVAKWIKEWKAGPHPDRPDRTISIVFNRVANDTAPIKGILVSEYLPFSQTSYLAYIAVLERIGLGQPLFIHHGQVMEARAHAHGATLQGSFLDCADPRKNSTPPGEISPERRIEIYNKWGAREVGPFNYMLPVGMLGERIENLTLIEMPLASGCFSSRAAKKAFLEDIWHMNGCPDPSSNFGFQSMIRSLRQIEPADPSASHRMSDSSPRQAGPVLLAR